MPPGWLRGGVISVSDFDPAEAENPTDRSDAEPAGEQIALCTAGSAADAETDLPQENAAPEITRDAVIAYKHHL